MKAISVVMPIRNSSTTIVRALKSLLNQKYSIQEIIVIDNASSDNSVEIVRSFRKKTKIPIKIVQRKKNQGLGSSFNYGVIHSKSEMVVLMHSDCYLQTSFEMEKLLKPLQDDPSVVASFPTIILSQKIWETYDFWEKCFFAREVGHDVAGLTTKFDCVRKNAYQKIGGFDVQNFGVGGEDADLHDRLCLVGKVVKSKAKVVHLHFLGQGFSFSMYLSKQKLYAKTYGRLIRSKGVFLIRSGFLLFVKPILAVLPIVPGFLIPGIALLVVYAYLYTRKMFTTKSVLHDPRILLLPLVNVFIVYYETFWMLESFLFGKNKIE